MFFRQPFNIPSFLIAAASLLPGAFSWAQAPACSGVFYSASITQTQIDKTVLSLAEMKMAADLAMSQGRRTLAAKRLRSSFSEKTAELLQRLGSRMSEIRKLQITESDSIKVESQARSEERVIQDSLVKKRFLVTFPTNSSTIQYVPSKNSLVLSARNNYGEGKIYVMDLDNGTSELIGSGNASGIKEFKVIGETVHMVDATTQYFIYDLNKKTDISPPHLNGRTTSLRSYLSPDAKFYVAETTHHITFTEMANPEHKFVINNPHLPGKFAETFLNKKLAINIKRSQFISTSQVFVTMDNNTYYNFDLSSRKTTPLDLGDFVVQNMKPAMEAGILAFTSENSVAIIPSDRLGHFKQEAKVKTFPRTVADISISPDGKLIYVSSLNEEQIYSAIYSTQDFSLIHEFETKQLTVGDGLFASPVFDLDRKRMIFGHYETDGAGEKQKYIDIWSYRE
jgi:Tol biopolymer transport system component